MKELLGENTYIRESSATYEDINCIRFQNDIYSHDDILADEALWTGYNMVALYRLSIYVSAATSKVVGFEVFNVGGYSLSTYPMSKEISDYEHQMDTLYAEAM